MITLKKDDYDIINGKVIFKSTEVEGLINETSYDFDSIFSDQVTVSLTIK